MKHKLFFIAFILLFTVLGSSTTFAQAKKSFRQMNPQERAEVRTEALAERVKLDQTQQSAIKAIYVKNAQERFAIRRQTKDATKRKELMQKIRQSEIVDVKAVLNSTQRMTYTKILSGEEPKLNFRNRVSAK